MTTTMRKWGNSQGIRIPKAILEAVHWSGAEKLSLKAEGDRVVIERAEPRKSIEELFANFDGEYTPVTVDWGNPVGNEIW